MASGSESGASLNFASSTVSIPQVMQNIAKHKAKRATIRKSIDKDHAGLLAGLKKRVGEHYKAEEKKMSNLEAQKLSRLIQALERRQAAENEISRRVEALHEDCAHIAMLLGAVYEGRGQAAQALTEKAGDPSGRR